MLDPQTMPADDHFPATKFFVVSYKKMSTPGPVSKHWLGFRYIRPEDYYFDQNFDYPFKKKATIQHVQR